jgi:type IV/VI secretion system ImpK/VasF family protein
MHRVHELTKKCFDHVFLLLQPQAITDVAKLHRSAADTVEAIEPKARKAGFSAEHARLIKYAMVALLDETAQAQPGQLSEYWEQHLLQRDYFNEVRAGEGFFVQLERLLEAKRDDAGALDVIQIYAMCIYLGFRGKFVARSDAKGFDALMRRVDDRLKERLVGDDELPASKPAEWRRPSPPLRVPVWLAGLAVLFSLVLLCGYRGELAEDAARLGERLGGSAR